MDRRMDMDDRENRNNGYDRGDICSQDNSPDNKPEQESIRETDCGKEVSRLLSMTEDIQVPPSLEPEAVEKKTELQMEICGGGRSRMPLPGSGNHSGGEIWDKRQQRGQYRGNGQRRRPLK